MSYSPVQLHLSASLNLLGSQVFNYLLGSLARVFTTLQEVDDKLILYSFIAAFALNAILAAQMAYYWNGSGGNTKKVKEAIDSSEGPTSTGSSTATAPSVKGKGPTTRRKG
jgi:mannose-P-dolichol utilization defect protein 1